MTQLRWIAVGLLITLAFLPSDGLGISVCPFSETFGLPCPACGLTRSMSSLLHFQVSKSVKYHPLGFFVLSALLVCLLPMRAFRLLNPGAFQKHVDVKRSLMLAVSAFMLVWIFRIT